LSDDGKIIDLNLVPQVVEFLGFVDFDTGKPLAEGKRDPKAPLRKRATARAVDPEENLNERRKPIFSTRKVTTTVSIYPEQSVVIVLGEAEKTDPFPPASPGKTLIAIITARPVGPSGSEEETLPPQSNPPAAEIPPSSAPMNAPGISKKAIDRLLFGPSKPSDSTGDPK
ncbi:MAG: hypothetical protein ABI680_16335, partial [Chthoniobacteraceae bacterium]